MKQLIAGVVILLVVGIGAFFYRNSLEHPAVLAPQVACTLEARLCPDGSSVGRSGPDCQFSACPFPNVELTSGATHLAFAVPTGYSENKSAAGTDATLIAAYEKSSGTITVRHYVIPEGKTATSTMLANTTYEPSGKQPKALSEFMLKLINAQTFYCTTLERFEGQVRTVCYLPHGSDVFRFEVLEKGVDWTNPNLDIDSLPEHRVFYGMLATLMPT